MTKAELITAVADKAGTSKKDAEAVVKALCDEIVAEVKQGGKVALPGFGTFELSERAARTGVNPATKAQISIPASRGLHFKMSGAVKEELNN